MGCLCVYRMLWSLWDFIEVSGALGMASGAFPPQLWALFIVSVDAFWGICRAVPIMLLPCLGWCRGLLRSLQLWGMGLGSIVASLSWVLGGSRFPSFGRVISGSLVPFPEFHLIAVYSV